MDYVILVWQVHQIKLNCDKIIPISTSNKRHHEHDLEMFRLFFYVYTVDSLVVLVPVDHVFCVQVNPHCKKKTILVVRIHINVYSVYASNAQRIGHIS